MFVLLRHAAYERQTGRLSETAEELMRRLGKDLGLKHPWREIVFSPTPRTASTAGSLHASIAIPLREDARLLVEGNVTAFLPPQEPRDLIFVTHLPVITNLLRAWSRYFHLEEPPLTELGCGYLIMPEEQRIAPL